LEFVIGSWERGGEGEKGGRKRGKETFVVETPEI